MAVVVFLLAIIYFTLFFVIGIYARKNNKSVIFWIFVSLTLTPIIALIILRGNVIQEHRKAIKRSKE